MVWIFGACTSSTGSSNLLTLKVEGRLWLLSQQPPIEVQSADIDPPSKRRYEARQPQTIPFSSLPSSRITRLRHQSPEGRSYCLISTPYGRRSWLSPIPEGRSSCQSTTHEGRSSCPGTTPEGRSSCQGTTPEGRSSCQGTTPEGRSSCQGTTLGGRSSCLGATPEGRYSCLGTIPLKESSSCPVATPDRRPYQSFILFSDDPNSEFLAIATGIFIRILWLKSGMQF